MRQPSYQVGEGWEASGERTGDRAGRGALDTAEVWMKNLWTKTDPVEINGDIKLAVFR